MDPREQAYDTGDEHPTRTPGGGRPPLPFPAPAPAGDGAPVAEPGGPPRAPGGIGSRAPYRNGPPVPGTGPPHQPGRYDPRAHGHNTAAHGPGYGAGRAREPGHGHRTWQQQRPPRGPRLVIDPLLAPEVSWTLRSNPLLLREARAHLARDHDGRRRAESAAAAARSVAHQGREAAGQVRKAGNADLFTFFSVVAFMVLMTGMANVGGVIFAMMVVGAVATVKWATAGSGNRKARRQLRVAIENADRYVLPEDLDHACQDLLRRTQDAVESVLASQVNQAGLIDTIDNRITLPEETWRIARQLARLSGMHAEHYRIVPQDLPGELAEAFRPYTAALNTALSSLTARVRALEDYAWRVHQADRVYQAYGRLEVLAERTPEYESLLADIVDDELAVPHIEQLSGRADQVRELFRQSIQDARLAAAHLLASRDLTDPERG